MALSNYDELVKEIISWGHRDDLNAKVPDFILIAETEMYNNELQPLQIRDMETIQETLTTGKYYALPDRFEKARSVRFVTDSGQDEVRYQAPEQLIRFPYTGKPNFYTVIGNQIEFDREPDTDYTIEIQYYARPENLSELNQTNTVLTNYPNIYLFGALTEFFTHAQEDAQAVKYNTRFLNAIKGANKSQKKGRFGPAPSMNLDRGNIV